MSQVHAAVAGNAESEELELQFMRGGSTSGDSVFPDESHARIMSHNLANYT